MSKERKNSQDTQASSSKALIPRSTRSSRPGAKRSSQDSSRASSRNGSNGSVTNQYQMVPEPMPGAGVVTVQVEERHTVLTQNQFLERDMAQREYVKGEQEIAQQRAEVEEQMERVEVRAAEVRAAAAEVACEKELLGQTAQQWSNKHEEVKEVSERANARTCSGAAYSRSRKDP